jgi:HD-like signal output (HDOD) protein
LNGIPPTGRRATVTAMTIDQLADGRVVEPWTIYDALGMLQQLGVIPLPELYPHSEQLNSDHSALKPTAQGSVMRLHVEKPKSVS